LIILFVCNKDLTDYDDSGIHSTLEVCYENALYEFTFDIDIDSSQSSYFLHSS